MNAHLTVAHDQHPLRFREMMNTLVTMAGGAIAVAFAVAILAMAAGLVLTAAFEVVQWLMR